MDGKQESFFSQLKNLCRSLQEDLNELHQKLSLPKSELPEDSSIIYFTHMVDELKVLEEETKKVENVLQELQKTRINFKNDVEINIKDIDEQMDNLESKLQNYGYIPWKQRIDIKEENIENEEIKHSCEENEVGFKVSSNPFVDLKKQNKIKTTPPLPLRTLPNLYNKNDRKFPTIEPTEMIIVTPKLNRTPSGRYGTQIKTPLCFNDDVVLTPGLFIPYSKQVDKGPIPKFELKFDQFQPFHFGLNQKFSKKITSRESPLKNWEDDVTVNLFKQTNLVAQKSNMKIEKKFSNILEEPILQFECKENNESFNTPEEPILMTNQNQMNALESLKKTLQKKKNDDSESNTPEEPLLTSEYKPTKVLEELKKNIRKKNVDNLGESSSTPEEPLLSTASMFCKEEPKTPEEPELKSVSYLQQMKRCRNLFLR